MMTFNLEELLKGAENIAVSAHVRPDGDAVGSTLGLYNYIKLLHPEKKVTLFLEKPEEVFSYLKGFDEIVTPEKVNELKVKEFDLFFALDLGDTERLGFAADFFESAETKACIDHHISNTGFTENDYIVPEASSTSELVYDLMDQSKIDLEIAKCIYTGIIHDTGIFQYSNTSEKTMRIAGHLISFGFDFTEIINKSFYEKTYVQTQIMGRAIMESIRFMDGRCIASMIDHKIMELYEATSQDIQGIASQLLLTKGVECAIFMYESAPFTYKVSMRSGNKVDVAEIATQFGGGGHKKAAGFTMSGTYHDILNNISELIEKQLEAAE
ncbi:DHH family phosphoesterase [Lachnospiraceae bacterium C1.1]